MEFDGFDGMDDGPEDGQQDETPQGRQRELLKGQLVLEKSRRRLGDDLRLFIPSAFRALEPDTPFVAGWHLDAIAEHLMAVTDGKLLRLIINIPPRCMKSLTVSVMWPAWEWIARPHLKYVTTAYGAPLALRDSVKMRSLVMSNWYQRLWGHRVSISADQAAKEEWHNTAGGFRYSAGAGGALPGMGGDRIIVDDPHKTDEAMSDLLREGVWEWWRTTLMSRVTDPQKTAKVVIMQRVHESDLVGHLLDEGGWTHLCLPMEYEATPFVHVKAVKPLTEDLRAPHMRTGTTPPGQPERVVHPVLLWEKRFGESQVSELKLAGSYIYSCQQQQRPAPAGGSLIKRSWFNFYDEDPFVLASTMDSIIQSWDTAVKGKTTSDSVAGQVWGKRGPNVFLLYRLNQKLDFPATCQAIQVTSAMWPTTLKKVIEDKANGPAVIDFLKQTVPGLVPKLPRGDKVQRLSAVAPAVESGHVYLPNPALHPEIESFLHQIEMFPYGSEDDDVDAFSQALDDLLVGGYVFDMLEARDLTLGKDQDAFKDRGKNTSSMVVLGNEPVLENWRDLIGSPILQKRPM